ncbi:nucleotidyltransferase domain-containing protein [Thermodesulfovibrio yellowstonii]|uniref:Nucleotidyltransferase n=1 Tax=Thermodesulfovibrio yellowstonii TaxID=28262 RepID=A0A9W6GEF1_9BACT|nr:nucleotidyltransferase domain-containing protein [Thermodesulfovibrio islandicus]GLI52470.1 nucleotidyltransferase [Thermodesulfovibrio islandicus]
MYLKKKPKFQEEKLESLGVVAILIFVSAVDGTFHKVSDIDFAVVLFKNRSAILKEPVKIYGEIYNELYPDFKYFENIFNESLVTND